MGARRYTQGCSVVIKGKYAKAGGINCQNLTETHVGVSDYVSVFRPNQWFPSHYYTLRYIISVSLSLNKMNYLKCQVSMLLNYNVMRVEAPVRGVRCLLLHHPAPVLAIITTMDQRRGSV